MSPWFPFACCVALLGSAFAQAPVPAEPRPARPERTVRGTCSEAASRDLFTACDADGDDRLDVLEAGSALEALRTPRDIEGFATIDRDRDGFVSWPEFDAHLRETLQRGATFRIRPLRPSALPVPSARPATPAQKFIQAYDADQNGGLDKAEVDEYLRKNKLGRDAGAQLWTNDLDHNGRLDETEIAPWLERVLGIAPPLDAPASEAQVPWANADQDGSRTIDENELASMLRRLDPSLAHWAAGLLRALDRNRDGVLQPAELPGFKASNNKTAAAMPPDALRQLPLRIPVR